MRRFFSFVKRHWLLTTIVVVVVLAVVGIIVSRKNKAGSSVLTDTVKKQDLKQTVLATGQVTSSTDLNLSFKGSGIVARVNVQVGDTAKAGDILANLDQKDQLASLTSARGSLAAAQANYQKVLDGSSSETVAVAQRSVDVAQVSLDNTKQQQDILVTNAYRNLLNSTPEAMPDENIGGTPVITGYYSSSEQGSYTIKAYQGILTGTGLEKLDPVKIYTNLALPLGTRGLYITFPPDYWTGNTWTINIPNKNAANYLTNYNAYQAALNNRDATIRSAQAALDSALAQLNLQKAQARPADISAAQAQVLSASGQVQAASASLENTIIRAPSDGTITTVDIKVGEQASPAKAVIVLQDVGNLHVEANVSEANIASVQLNQEVTFTFDALGPDREFKGTVQTIDPASTVISGVVNYKVTASVEKLPEIKPGMTANMTILTAVKPGVLAIPQRAVLSHDSKKFVRVIDDPKKKTYHEVEVTTGLEADGGLTELLSGLDEGQQIVSFINTK